MSMRLPPPLARAALPIVLVSLAVLLVATAVPGIFTIDEDHYLTTVVGVQHGTVHVPFTDGLTTSPELLAFDPAPRAPGGPPAVTAPPLYAFIAYPFAWLGLRGLIALQALAFALTAWLVFRVVRRELGRTDLAWLALGTHVAAGFSLEYAQGIWPHMLSALLVMTSVTLIGELRRSPRWLVLGAGAGLALGLATGVRYQNAVFLGVAVLVIAWLNRRAAVAFVIAAALPLAASSAINASRLGSYNPISKGTGYFATGQQAPTHKLQDAVVSSWARVVDYSAWRGTPEDVGEIKAPGTGAVLVLGTVKKSLVQSAPWAALALAAMLVAWARARRRTEESTHERELRTLFVFAAALLGAFAVYGFRRDGWCFNQRYLLELVPLLACALALALADLELRWGALLVGALAGAALAIAAVQLAPDSTLGQLTILKLPLVLAAGTTLVWFAARRRAGTLRRTLAALLGASLGWACAIHIAADVATSRGYRAYNRQMLATAREVLPTDAPLALFAYQGAKDPLGPLLLERDIVFVDPSPDKGADARMLLEQLQTSGRRVFLHRNIPLDLARNLLHDRLTRPVQGAPWLLEIGPVSGAAVPR